ncbi:DUF982 domain-containing protein [Mesorhizobium sp.]|uniref:DUF982 domain-containing protein n=2 Tax=unclassified Mesorhizobium TaxID=325217 RepID=UPI00351A2B04
MVIGDKETLCHRMRFRVFDSRGFTMNQGWFSRPVSVSVGIAGATRHILSAQQAVELLAGHWRDAGSLQHSSALRACRRAMSGDVSAEIARDAFVGAAREAHVLVE